MKWRYLPPWRIIPSAFNLNEVRICKFIQINESEIDIFFQDDWVNILVDSTYDPETDESLGKNTTYLFCAKGL